MGKWRESRIVKATVIVLFVLTVLLGIGGIFGTIEMADYWFYHSSQAAVTRNVQDHVASHYCDEICIAYLNYGTTAYVEPTYRNFWFELEDENGTVLCSSYDGQYCPETFRSVDCVSYEEVDEAGQETMHTLSVTLYLQPLFTRGDLFYTAVKWTRIAYAWRYAIPIIGGIALLLAAACYLFLWFSAGHRADREKITANWVDRLPFDVVLAVLFLLGLGSVALVALLFDTENLVLLLLGGGMIGVLDLLLFVLLTMTFATRCKLGTLFRGMLLYRILRVLFNGLKRIGKHLLSFVRQLPLIWRTVLLVCGVLLAELALFAMFVYNSEMLFLLWLLAYLVFALAVFYVAIMLRDLQKAGRELAAGNLDYRVDTRRMLLDLKEHGENLNSLSVGLACAVEERLKSERLKTELITNVSHDIRTPLTSIINYVDLMKKEELPTETLRDYVAVLDRQSNRLKKLIDDLVEASKASTGNLSVELEPCEVGVLLSQVMGEYQERLERKHLELILHSPAKPVVILADGRRLWRVFDNLLNNIDKYAQADTRVYLDLTADDKEAEITFKNVSREALNITAEELMERFVRGDASRSTEGSGLGLAIAKSLTELQGGTMQLVVDGDLFKVQIRFPLCDAKQQDEAGMEA